MVNGFFLGGAAQGMQTAIDNQQKQQGLALQGRQLDLQQQQQQFTQQQQLLDQADKAISNTMSIVGDTIKATAAKPDLMTSPDAYAQAISSVESGGNYGLKGPVTSAGDRAYGKYQVMGANVPEWTKEVTGTAMTPEQFLASPSAQDAVFQAKFGQYVDQTGNADDAASMWFSGKPLKEGASLQDQLGTTGGEYVQKFRAALSAIPQQKMRAAVAPLVNDVTSIAAKAGKNPNVYSDQVDAVIKATPVGVDSALKAGQDAAAQKIGEANGLIKAGVSQASAMITAGIAGGILSPDQRINAESTLRGQYVGLAKDFQTVRDSYQKLSQSASGTAAGDMSLIFNYMKMLDPSSVVREGEYATVQNATGVPGQIANLWNQLLSGGRLNDAQRADLMTQAQKLYTSTGKQQDFTADQFRQIAARGGLDPRNVVVDLSAAPGTTTPPPVAPGAAAPSPTTPPPVGTVQGGYRFNGGDPSNENNWIKLN